MTSTNQNELFTTGQNNVRCSNTAIFWHNDVPLTNQNYLFYFMTGQKKFANTRHDYKIMPLTKNQTDRQTDRQSVILQEGDDLCTYLESYYSIFTVFVL